MSFKIVKTNKGSEGILTFNLNDPKEKDQALFLVFHPRTKGSEVYRAVLDAIPRVHGYKRDGEKRFLLAYDIVDNLRKEGYTITKK